MDTEAFPQRRKRLLVATRFSPLNGSSGAGTYLFSILDFLHRNGFRITACWSEIPASARRHGWYRVPRDFDCVAKLLFPESFAIGRLRVFPKIWWLPFKARCLDKMKRTLFALGLGALFNKVRRETPSPGEKPSNEPTDFAAWDRPLDAAEIGFFTGAIAKVRPGTILFNFCWITPLAESIEAPERYAKFTLTNDLRYLYSTLVDGAIRHTEGEGMSRRQEQRLLESGDAIIAIREDDAEAFTRLLPGKKIITAPPSFLPVSTSGQPVPQRCLFVASDAEANREGITWFLQYAWPLIRATRPDAELHLCGPICYGFDVDAPGVVLRGYVDSLEAEYKEAAVVIVPLLRGSGVKIKLLEALAHGKAAVTTPIGTEGLPVLESCTLIAANPEDFARNVLFLLSHPKTRRQLEDKALKVIEEQFNPTACYGPLLDHMMRG